MKKLITIGFIAVIMALSIGQAIATKPGEETNPNGFPSGPHFNLNIIGKKDEFVCPDPDCYLKVTDCAHGGVHLNTLVKMCPEGDTCVETDPCIPYGNVVFIPEDSGEGENKKEIEIYIQSGRRSGKRQKDPAIPDELRVIDPCAWFDGDGAYVDLPHREEGYYVYARALAKPTDDPNIIITPELSIVEDDDGNDLVIYLGLVTPYGFKLPSQSFVRSKGNSTAIPITDLFIWTGVVCYLDPLDAPDGIYEPHDVCAIDDDGDGLYDRYIEPDPVTGCPEGSTLITVYCHQYTEEWVFNIGDFVEILWDTVNNGVKLLQVRFYEVNPESDPEAAPPMHNTLTIQWGKIKNE